MKLNKDGGLIYPFLFFIAELLSFAVLVVALVGLFPSLIDRLFSLALKNNEVPFFVNIIIDYFFILFCIVAFVFFIKSVVKLERFFIRWQAKEERSIQDMRRPEAESRRLKKKERDETEIEED